MPLTAAEMSQLNERLSGGFDTLLGLKVTAASGDGVSAELEVRPELLQPHGILHGGVLCSIVESVASVGASLWLGEADQVVGVSNSTDFLRASTSGTLTAVGVPIHRGRSQQLWAVEIRDASERLVAKGQVRLQNLRSSERAKKD